MAISLGRAAHWQWSSHCRSSNHSWGSLKDQSCFHRTAQSISDWLVLLQILFAKVCLRVIDESNFGHLLEIAEPRFQLPHRTHFTDKVIPAKYRTVRANVEKQLATMEKCTMTTDLWTAQHQQCSYISLTVHFVAFIQLYHCCCSITATLQFHHWPPYIILWHDISWHEGLWHVTNIFISWQH